MRLTDIDFYLSDTNGQVTMRYTKNSSTVCWKVPLATTIFVLRNPLYDRWYSNRIIPIILPFTIPNYNIS